LIKKFTKFALRFQVFQLYSSWPELKGNPVKYGSCTRSCKSNKSFGIPRHCYAKSEMGRQPKQDEPEDLPVTYFVAFG